MPKTEHLTIIDRWRAELLARVLRIAFPLGVVVAIPSILYAIAHGRPEIVIIDALAIGLVATAALAPNIAYRTRAMLPLAVVYGLGAFFLPNVGVMGVIYLLSFPVLAALLLGMRPALLGLALNGVTLAVLGVLGAIDPRLAVGGVDALVEWLLIVMNLLFVDALLAVSGALLLRRLERSLTDEQELSASLTAERTTLSARNEALEHEAAQRQRAEAEQRFQAQLLEAVGEAVIATDSNGVVQYVNPAAERLYGWPANEVLGRPVLEVAGPEMTRDRAEAILDQVRSGQTWVGELQVPRHDGTTFPMLVSSAPYFADDGGLAGLIAVATDVSELRETIDKLARSEEIRIAFLRATSHELRTPLTAIFGLTETLQEYGHQIEPKMRADLVDRLVVNAGRLDRLITDLLDVDRLASGMVTANCQQHDVRDLVLRVLAEVDDGGRHLETDLALVSAHVDAPKVERVVANLVWNALRHCPVGGTVKVTLERTGGSLLLRVEDDGPGIDPDYLELIFEPFVQGPDRHRDAKPGTGLGLALAREFVRLHDGEITAANRPEGGARFEVRLPVGGTREEPVELPRAVAM